MHAGRPPTDPTRPRSGATKKIPACTRNRKKNEVTPSRSWMFAALRVDQRRLAARDAPVLHIAEQANRPASTSQITGESRSHSGEPGLGRANPHAPDYADHDQPEAGRRQPGADQVEPGALLACVSFTRLARPRITITKPHSRTPTATRRSRGRSRRSTGPTAAAIAPAAGPDARGRSGFPKFEATSATMAIEHRAEALQERPADDQGTSGCTTPSC